MKRFACYLLAICFIMGLLPSLSMTVSAEEPIKLQTAVLDFAYPAAGDALPTAFTVNEGFVIDQYTWEIYQDGVWQILSEPQMQFAADQTYRLRVQLVCADGYYIDFASFPSGYMPAFINGEAAHATFFADEKLQPDARWSGVTLETVIFGSAVPAVRNLDISGIPSQNGEHFSPAQIRLDHSDVTVRSCQINVDGEAADDFQFDYGYYNIHIDLIAAPGVVLDLQSITINGLPIRECGWDVAYDFEVGEGWISLSCEREPDGYVDGVTVSGAPFMIQAGESISVPELSVKWSSNGSVSISRVQWMDSDFVPVSGNFAAEQVYYLAITLHTDGATPFRDFFNLELLHADDSYHCAALATVDDATTAVAYIRYALLPTLENIQIRLPEPAVGDAPVAPSADDAGHLTISSYSWTDMESGSDVSVFEHGHRYQLKFRIEPVLGYQLQVGTSIFVNGAAVQTVTDPDGQSVTVEFSFCNNVERVEFVVQQPTDQGVPAMPSLLDSSCVAITGAKWINSQTGLEVDRFTPGVRYYLEMEIRAADGYALTNQTEFIVNGNGVKAAVTGNSASLRLGFDLVKTLTQVQLYGVPQGIQPGDTAAVPTLSLADKDLSFADICWVDEDKEPFDGVFEAGNIYYLAITLKASSLLHFDDVFTLLGDHGTLTEASSEDGLNAVVYIRYSLLKVVDRAEITVSLPQVGDAPAVPLVGADVPYSILSYSWKDLSTGEICTVFAEGHRYVLTVAIGPSDDAEFGELLVLLNGEQVPLSDHNAAYASFTVEYSFRGVIDRIDLFAPELAVGKQVQPSDIAVLTEGVSLQSGRWINAVTFEDFSGIVEKARYTLRASMKPIEGFEFSDAVQVYLNGQLVADVAKNPNGITCSVEYDLRDRISDIQIFGMPQVVIGGSTASVSMGVADGATYTVNANWLLYAGDYQFAGPGATFENNKVYYLEILIKPAPGYFIADDATVFVDGSAFSGIIMAGDTGIWLYKQYNCGLQVIDRVDLIVDVPAVGGLPGTVTVSGNSSVLLRDITWSYSETGEFADAVDLLEGDIFEAGFHYMISGSLVADKGYVFAENLTITVNGVPSNIDLGDLGVINLGDTAFLGHSFGLLQQSVQEPDPTGDSIGIVFALLLCSGGAWLTLKNKR